MLGSTNKKKALAEIRQICQEIRKKPSEMSSLDLTNTNLSVFTPDIVKKLSQFTFLIDLTLVDCSIISLQTLPPFRQLQFIDLSANRIADCEITYLTKYFKLHTITLNNNLICKLDVFKQFRKLQTLEELQLEHNPVAQLDDYRSTAFRLILGLRSLDGYDIEGKVTLELSDYSQDQIISEIESNDSDDNNSNIQPVKKKRKYKRKDQEVSQGESQSFEPVPPNYVKVKR